MKAEAVRKTAAKRLLLVDGHAYAYRAFFAIRKLDSGDGRPVNAIYGFIQMLEGLIEQLDPTHLCVVWDGGLSPDRMDALPGYKAQRPPMPDDLRTQLDGIVEYLGASGIESFCGDEIEADDYIGCLAVEAAGRGFFVVIASPDKDFMQLVSEQIRIFNPGDKSGELMGPAEVAGKTGVSPGQIIDWLSLIGDSVDNIPGVPGIGPKTATKLLVAYDSISGIYDRLAELDSDRLREALSGAKDVVKMNRGLIQLRTGLPCAFSDARFSRRKRDLPALRSLCGKWGFRRMLAKLEEPAIRTPELALL